MTPNRSPGYAKSGLSKLRGLSLIRLLSIFTLLACLLAVPGVAQAKETLIWLLRDLPPLTIFEGPQKGRGAIDQLIPLLIASMPEYEHQIVRVNRARGMQMLLAPSFTCDPSLIWNKERAQRIVYSITSLRIMSNGLAVRLQDRAALAPFMVDGQVDLGSLLAASGKKLGVVAERSYGQPVDGLLHQAAAEVLAAHYGNDALGSLLQMQRLGRLSALLGYWPEIRYQAQQQGISPTELAFYPIKDTEKYQSIHVGCSDTAQGHQAITRINKALGGLRQDTLSGFYAAWLDPEMRRDYLADAKAFFQGPPQE
ncbi:TIGR02285 family protein [Pseudomonas fluorescens]|uniref:TIGR02285 family protein n=1 Tax=Pseudomonas fluorescens TaxID=294 RepID=UPI001241746F|nr:TIGR02285 family protein [Pseudomonas fluorescens]